MQIKGMIGNAFVVQTGYFGGAPTNLQLEEIGNHLRARFGVEGHLISQDYKEVYVFLLRSDNNPQLVKLALEEKLAELSKVIPSRP